MKNNILFILLAFISILSGCMKDESLFIPDPGVTYTSSILGIVTDESNNPVEGAVVSFNGLTKTTDKNGIYQFKDVEVSSNHSFLKIRKAGYFDGSRAFNTQQKAKIRLTNTLLAKSFNKNFNSSTGGEFAGNGYNLKFPANSIKVESTGASYNGTVNVAVKWLDPSLQSTLDRMPGNLVGLSLNHELNNLSTFGMLCVELQASNGEKLQLKDTSSVAMTMNVPSGMIAKAPSTIPLWYFDESIGYWKEEGSATLNPQTGTYTGNVSHFSFWNCDYPYPLINLSGKVLDQNGNPLIGNIKLTFNGNSGYAYTNTDGTFSGAVPKDETFTLEVIAYSGNCMGKPLIQQQIGPFSSNTILPDIIVNVPPAELFEFTSNVNKCDGNPVTDGYAKVQDKFGSHYFPINNGHVEGSIITCYTPVVESIVFIDEENFVQSDVNILNGIGPHNLGTQLACGNIVDHITVVNANIPLNIYRLDFLVVDSIVDKFIYIPYDSIAKDIEIFSFSYSDFNINGFTADSFQVTSATTYIFKNQKNYFISPGNGNGMVYITQGGSSGSTLIGTYDLNMKESGTGNIENFKGEFQWKIP